MPIPAAMASWDCMDMLARRRSKIVPSSGWSSPYSTFISVRLAGPVLTKQAMDFTRADVQVDRVIGDQVAESLGDPRSRRPAAACGDELDVTSQS